MKVKETTDYDQFKLIEGNRVISPAHLLRLTESIATKNLLQYNPILVNEDLEIIDGQHRLKAAARLSIPIYYVEVPVSGLEEVQLLNACNRRWQMNDYLESYVARGKPAYIALKEFMEEHGLTASISMLLLTGHTKGTKRLRKDFKEGVFEISDLEEAQKLAKRIIDFKPYTEYFVWKHRTFIAALKRAYKQVGHEELLDKTDRYSHKIKREFQAVGYLRQLEDIYNRGCEERNWVRFY